MRIAALLTAILALGPLAGCNGGSSTSSTSTNETPAWMLAVRPAGAVPVAQAKTAASEGDLVAVHGRIGGRRDPISTETAVFVMMDPAIPSCADTAHDGCPTPWDYCCETPASKKTNGATVQLVDASGAALALDLSSFGIEPLDEIIVVGTVGPRPTADVLTIKATKFHRVGG